MTKKNRQTRNESHRAPPDEAPRLEEESPLSPRRAFVVQFREETDAASPRFTGRVEHIVSGHAARFSSPEELWAFFTQVLRTVRAKPP